MPPAGPGDRYGFHYEQQLQNLPPLPGGGFAAAGSGGGRSMSTFVAGNVRLPRASRGHPNPTTGEPELMVWGEMNEAERVVMGTGSHK